MVNLSTYYKRSAGDVFPLFMEVQRYRRVWVWMIIGLTFGILLLALAVQWLYRPIAEEYWLSLPSLALLGGVMLLIAILVYRAHLTTKIDDHGIQFRLFPFQWVYQQVSWQDVEEVYIREYDAMAEYGGRGVKYGQSGKSYTISGQFGIQLVLSDDRRILIGTHRPIELEQLILRLLYDYEIR